MPKEMKNIRNMRLNIIVGSARGRNVISFFRAGKANLYCSGSYCQRWEEELGLLWMNITL